VPDPVDQRAAPDRDRVDEAVGVDGDTTVRQGAHVGQHIVESGDCDREAGLGGRLAHDGVVGVFAVVDGAAGQRPDARRAGTAGGADEQHAAVVVGGNGVGGDPAERFECGGHRAAFCPEYVNSRKRLSDS
jgi:hypothetical protein